LRPRISPLAIGVLSVCLIVLFAPLILNMITNGNDYPGHIKSAVVLETTGQFDRPRPQFLYHIALILLNRIIPSTQAGIAALMLGLLCYLALGFIILLLLNRRFCRMPPRVRLIAPIVLTLMLMFMGPINFLTQSNLYFGYIAPYSYHNPTVVLLRPFAVILFLLAVQIFEGGKADWITLLICALIAVASTLAKPNYGIALIPALILFAIYLSFRKYPVDWRLLGAIILPVMAVLGWQLFFYQDQGMGGFEFAPFKVALAQSDGRSLLPKLLLSIMFPAVVYALYFQEARHILPLNLAWLTFWIAAFYYYFFAEKRDWTDGNFLWGAEVTLMILLISSLSFFIRQSTAVWPERRFTLKFGIGTLLFVLHLIGGIALYVSSLSLDWRAWL
jgi:hypothetical protein